MPPRQHAAEMLCLFVSSLPNLIIRTYTREARANKSSIQQDPTYRERIQKKRNGEEKLYCKVQSAVAVMILTLRVDDADTDDKECNPSPPGLLLQSDW